MTDSDHQSARDLLFEIGVEDLPSRFLTPALADLAATARRQLERLDLEHGAVTTLGSPRRLTLHVTGLVEQQPAAREVKTGPPLHVAYDGEGNPTKAALSFAAKFGCTEADLQTVDTPKGQRVQVEITTGGAATAELLPELLASVVEELPLPKAMRWGARRTEFLRPIRWLVALYGAAVVELEIAGVSSDRTSRGQRFLAPGGFELADAGLEAYSTACAEHGVLVDDTTVDDEGRTVHSGARHRELERGLSTELEKLGAAGFDADLLLDVCNMVEHPHCLTGSFEERFLELPEAVVVSTLREYQKYFDVRNAAGELLPRFIAVRDGGDRNAAGVVAGHERVLRARLTDAGYFWEEARRTPLEELTPQLDGLRFIRGLGSYADKRERLLQLTAIANVDGVCAADSTICDHLERAVDLAKQDLLTPLVIEFTSLQGVIGGELARLQGEPEPVAAAIAEQYRPKGFSGRGDELPQSAVGCLLALLDKLDTLAGCFAVGLEPSGSADPFGLRRAARGVVGITMGVEDHRPAALDQRRLSVSPFISAAVAGFKGRTKKDFDVVEVEERLRGFLTDRALRLFVELEAATDAARAALARYPDRYWAAWRAARALTEAKGGEDFANVAAGFKRAANILKQAAERGIDYGAYDPALVVEDAERALAERLTAIRESGELAELTAAGDYGGAIARIAGFRPLIDTFFDDVLVMADDQALRDNRLALLASLVELFGVVGDLSRIGAA